MMLLLAIACSEYTLDKSAAPSPEAPDTGVEEPEETDTAQTPPTPPDEECNGGDDNGDGAVDEGFGDVDADGTADCVDAEECDGIDNDGDGAADEGFDANGDGVTDCFEEEAAYCTPFDDFSGWSYIGTGDWYIEEGMLTEGRNGGYVGLAYLHDLGFSGRFMLQTDVAWGGEANDYTGLVWGLDGDSLLVAVWDDPQDYYNRYDPTGAIRIWTCDAHGESCTEIAIDSSADLYWPAGMSFVTWSVLVDGDRVTSYIGDTLAFDAVVPGIAGTGPGVVGVYSNDNDGVVWFDNYCVWMGD